MKLYTARFTDADPNGAAVFFNQPAGQLFQSLPADCRTHRRWGTEDPWDGAEFTNEAGRVIVISGIEYFIPAGPWFVRTDRQFYDGHPQPYCVATHSKHDDEEHELGKIAGHRWLFRLFDGWSGEDIALAHAAAALPNLRAVCGTMEFHTQDIAVDAGCKYSVELTGEEIMAIREAWATCENLTVEILMSPDSAVTREENEQAMARCLRAPRPMHARPYESREAVLDDLLWRAMPYVEDAKDDPAYKRDVVPGLLRRIKAALKSRNA